MGKLSLRGIADVMHTTPGIKAAMLQQWEHSLEYDTPIKKQGGDGREKGNERESVFRLVIWSDAGKMAEVQTPKLADTISQAFAEVGLKVPKEIAESLGL